MKRIHGIHQLEPMCHQWFEVDQPPRNQSQSFGVLVGVAVLEREVDFVRVEVPEWVLVACVSMRPWDGSMGDVMHWTTTYGLFVWSHTNDKDFASKRHRLFTVSTFPPEERRRRTYVYSRDD